jgi:hypothetical protein
MRHLVLGALYAVAGAAFLLGAASLLTTPEVIRNNEAFRSGDLATAIQWVESERAALGVLPSEERFNAWMLTRGWENRAIFYKTTGSLEAEDCSFEDIQPGSYGIAMWRGDWNECYAAWKNAYSFDHTLRDNIAFAIAMMLVGAGAVIAGRRMKDMFVQSPNSSLEQSRDG